MSMTSLFYAVLNAVQEAYWAAGSTRVSIEIRSGGVATIKGGLHFTVRVYNGPSIIVQRVGFEQEANIKGESEIEAQLRIVKLFPPDTVESRAKAAFYGGEGSEILTKQFPNGCDLATAVRFFRSREGVLSCGELVPRHRRTGGV